MLNIPTLRAFGSLLLLMLSTTTLPAAKPHYSVSRTTDYLMIFQDGTPAVGYRILPRSLDGKYARNNYVDLYDLQGREITEDFPADHLHHRGVFWAWHQVLVGGKQLGDSWECRDFIWDSKQVQTSYSHKGVELSTTTHWSSPDLTDTQDIPVPVVREETRILVHKTRRNYRLIDFHITIQPLVNDLQLGGSENDKGYGGFSPRLKLPADVKFWSTDGVVTPMRTAVEAGPWVNVEGTFFESDLAPSSFAIICHPENPVYPDKWILRARGSMQNAAYPGQHAVAVKKDQPLVLRYRLVVQSDGHNPKRLEKLSRQF